MAQTRRKPEPLVALGVLALSGLVWWQIGAIPDTPLYSHVGPKIFPRIVAAGLTMLGFLLLFEALTGRWRYEDGAEEPPEASVPVDWSALAWLGLGLLLNVALIGPLGFVLASTLLFICVARAFGSRQTLRDAVVAFLLALVTYLFFARLLGISIGTGVFERLLGGAG